jgi:hypothetical protein
MNFKNKHISIASLMTVLLLSALLYSCGDDDMQLSYQHAIQAGTYSTVTKADTTLANASVVALGAPNSVLYKDVTSINNLFLVPNLHADSTSFNIKNNKSSDIVTFFYTKKAEPISGSGGITININISNVKFTKNFIDTITIENPGVNYNENSENVKIYIKN